MGNAYEDLWALDNLLRIVDQQAEWLIPEPIDCEESRGIEFQLGMKEGVVEHWSIKRQTTRAAGWTLALLTAKQPKAAEERSILGDLFFHLGREPTDRAVFASQMAAQELSELNEYAKDPEVFEERLKRSGNLAKNFKSQILPLCPEGRPQAIDHLNRTLVRTADQTQLSERVDFAIRKLLRSDGSSQLDPLQVRGRLGEVLQERLHQKITRDHILDKLGEVGIGLNDWAARPSVLTALRTLREGFLKPRQQFLIQDRHLPVDGVSTILASDGLPSKKILLITGPAGIGKSTGIVLPMDSLVQRGVPVAGISMDQLPSGLSSTSQLGDALGLPESPALVLQRLANGGSSVIFVDQLDAISLTSGRNTELWGVFDALVREVRKDPNQFLVVGCREFDLANDFRMRSLLARDQTDVGRVDLGPLDTDQVKEVLSSEGVDLTTFKRSFLDLLSLPLHLWMYLAIEEPNRAGIGNLEDLFSSFWEEKRQRLRSRLGSPVKWTQVIDALADWLSANQRLSAPAAVLDEVRESAEAMASENVLVHGSDGQFRFFHETFFDYAFARRFAARQRSLKQLLQGEQALFRRAQVRQVLAYLRASGMPSYMAELTWLLRDEQESVRFHIRRYAISWLSQTTDIATAEWTLLASLLATDPGMRPYCLAVIGSNPSWFDKADEHGFLESGLSSDDPELVREILGVLLFENCLTKRSERLAELVSEHRTDDRHWENFLRQVVFRGKFFASREMFDLYLTLIDEGALKLSENALGGGGSWWSVHQELVEESPSWFCEVVGRWLGRVTCYLEGSSKSGPQLCYDTENPLMEFGNFDLIVEAAEAAPSNFVSATLNWVVTIAERTASDQESATIRRSIWSSSGLPGAQELGKTVLSALVRALERMAKSQPERLADQLASFTGSDLDVVVLLLLRSWSANPARFGENIVDYLTANVKRLDLPTSGEFFDVGSKAIASVATSVPSENRESLESAVLQFTPAWELRNPKRLSMSRGATQLRLLRAFDEADLSEAGRARLRELERKFPTHGEVFESQSTEGTVVRSPIPEAAQQRMTDDQWIKALRKYAGVNYSHRPNGLFGGGEELARDLEKAAATDPLRFAALADRLDDELATTYLDSILRGVGDSEHEFSEPEDSALLDKVSQLIRNADQREGKASGQAIAHLLGRKAKAEWPEDILDIAAWYATQDPDPPRGGRVWNGQDSAFGFDNPFTDGINTVRGAMAYALAKVLLRRPELIERLQPTIQQLASDESVSVRACAVASLLAIQRQDPTLAIELLDRCVGEDLIITESPYAARLLQRVSSQNFDSIKPLLTRMRVSQREKVVSQAARLLCLMDLDESSPPDVLPNAESVRRGLAIERAAAADVYAVNLGHPLVGRQCLDHLLPLLGDQDAKVREQAAGHLDELKKLDTPAQSAFLDAFLEGNPTQQSLMVAVHVLQDSDVQLPGLVCTLCEQCVSEFRDDASDLSNRGSAVAMDLSKLVVRLYGQSEDAEIRERCLDMIDEMERNRFLGIADQLESVER